MDEPITEPGTTPPGTPTVPEPATTGTFINEDMSLAEGWKGKYLSEDIRGEPIFDRVRNLPDAFKTLAHQEKLVSKKGIIMPAEGDDPTIWGEFFNSCGRPPESTGYQYETPEDFAEEMSPEALAPALERLHAKGATQSVVKEAISIHAEYLKDMREAEANATQTAMTDAKTALEAKWGVKYPERLHDVNKMITDNSINQEMQDYIVSKIGNDPIVGDFLANISAKFTEHGIVTDMAQTGPAIGDIKTKIRELEASKPYMEKTHIDHKSTVERLSELYKQKAEVAQTTSV